MNTAAEVKVAMAEEVDQRRIGGGGAERVWCGPWQDCGLGAEQSADLPHNGVVERAAVGVEIIVALDEVRQTTAVRAEGDQSRTRTANASIAAVSLPRRITIRRARNALLDAFRDAT